MPARRVAGERTDGARRSAASVKARRFSPPSLHVDVLDRPRLRPPPRHALLVQAPAGFGKTVLLTQIWSQADKRRVRAWLTLKRADRAFERFRVAVAEALTAPNAKLPALCACPDASGLRLGEWLSEQTPPPLVVFDDYHEAASSDVDAFMRALLGARGDACIAIGSRTRPEIGAAALIARGEMTLVDADALRFRAEETKALFNGHGRSDDVARAQIEADGWPIALRLARQALASGRAAGALGAAKREIAGYLVEETFKPLAEALQTFLIETAALDALTAEEADELRERRDSAELLRQLARSGALVYPAAPAGLRRHQLLTAYVEQRFAMLPQVRREILLDRAMAQRLHRGDALAAMTVAERFDPALRALDAIESAPADAIWNASALNGLAGELAEKQQASFEDAPRLWAARAIGQLRAGRAVDAAAAAEAASRALASRAEAATTPEARREQVVWAGLRAAAFASGDAPLADVVEEARADRSEMSALSAHAAAVLKMRAGEEGEALWLARHAVQAAKHPATAAFAAATEAVMALACGAPDRAPAALAAARRRSASDNELNTPALDVCAAWLARQRGEAWRQLAQRLPDTPWLMGISMELLTESACLQAAARDDAASARAVLTRALGLAARRGWRASEAALEAEQLRCATRWLDPAAGTIAHRLGASPAAAAPESVLALGFHELSAGRKRVHGAAVQRLETVVGDTVLPRRLRQRAAVLQARAAQRAGNQSELEAALKTWCALSPDGAMAGDFFDEGGGELWTAFTSFASTRADAAEMEHRLRLLADLAVARGGLDGEPPLPAPSARDCALIGALLRSATPTDRAPLRTGARARAADLLGLTESTFKYRLKVLLRKWGVRDWRAAAKVAERMVGAEVLLGAAAAPKTHRNRAKPPN